MKRLFIGIAFTTLLLVSFCFKVKSQTLISNENFYQPNKAGFFYETDNIGFAELSSRFTADSTDDLKNIDSLNKNNRFMVFGSSGISGLEDLGSSLGNTGVGFIYRLSRFKKLESKFLRHCFSLKDDEKNRLVNPQYLYVMFNFRSGKSEDSSVIQKTFLFPELVRRNFVIGYQYEAINAKTGWRGAFNAEFSLSEFDSSGQKSFPVQNFVGGFKFSRNFYSEKLKTSSYLQVFLYYHFINVDTKFKINYRDVIGEESLPTRFHNLGLQTIIQIKNVALFSNMKYVFNRDTDKIQSPDLKSFVYTIGTSLFF